MDTPELIDRRAQILHAARDVFAREGYSKASIKKIAAQANLNSPALIYWYFDNKAELFTAVLSEASLLLQEISSNQQLKEMEPQDALTLVAQRFIQTFDEPSNKRIFRILISESTTNSEVSNHFAENIILPVKDFLVPYFQKLIDQNILRPHNPETSARAFVGTIVHYVFYGEIFPELMENHPIPGEYVQETVKIFLEGLRDPS